MLNRYFSLESFEPSQSDWKPSTFVVFLSYLNIARYPFSLLKVYYSESKPFHQQVKRILIRLL